MFLYPIPEYINHLIENSFGRDEEELKQRCKILFDKCIDLRYRQKGFEIVWATFYDHEISELIPLRPEDTVIETEIDFKTHTTKKPDGTYQYPNLDYLLDKLNETTTLRLGGFHIWDCVKKLARRAHERGLDVLIDEDLTEFFRFSFVDPNFKPEFFPSCFPKKDLEMFMRPRKGKPWFHQYY